MKTDLFIATLSESIATLYRVHPHRRTEIHAILRACIVKADASARLDAAPKNRGSLAILAKK